MSENVNMSYVMTVRLFKGEKCFGPGIAELLRLVGGKRSLRSAAMEMGMAYSKAWRIIKEMEASLGFKLLVSSTGGKNGGGASLTPEAEDILRRYDDFTRELSEAGDKLFEKHFKSC